MVDKTWNEIARDMQRKGFSATEILKAKPRKVRRDASGKKLEYDEQKAFVKWVRTTYPQHRRRLVAIENASHKGSLMRCAMAKATGMVEGASDLFFRFPCGGFHGLWIEMKKHDGKATPDELRFQEEARADGYAAVVCLTAEAAKVAFRRYLSEIC